MRHPVARIVGLLSLAGVIAGCGGSPFSLERPEPAPAQGRAEFTMKLSGTQGNPGNPVQIFMRLANPGTREILIGCPSDRDLTLFGPDGQVVRHGVFGYIGCTGPVPFASGETREWSSSFIGQLYSDSGHPSPAPSGVYTVLARFEYAQPGGSGFRTIERVATFTWNAP